jgi:short-subunit dehydrogenase
MSKKVALVTGGSSGIGALTAIRLAGVGFITYAAARRLEKMENLKEKGVTVVRLDVASQSSIDACIAQINSESGGIDILVNNAGYGSYGSVEEVAIEEARRQFEVNLFGLAALTQLVIPHMRKQRWGRIINISSIAGLAATPFAAWYSGSKFAVEAFSHALRQELEPFDVDVVIIRPGPIKTEWSDIAMDSLLQKSGNGPYGRLAQAMEKSSKKMFASKLLSGNPNVIADVIVSASLAKKPRAVYTAPLVANLQPALRWLLTDRMFDGLTRWFLKLPKKL